MLGRKAAGVPANAEMQITDGVHMLTLRSLRPSWAWRLGGVFLASPEAVPAAEEVLLTLLGGAGAALSATTALAAGRA